MTVSAQNQVYCTVCNFSNDKRFLCNHNVHEKREKLTLFLMIHIVSFYSGFKRKQNTIKCVVYTHVI